MNFGVYEFWSCFLLEEWDRKKEVIGMQLKNNELSLTVDYVNLINNFTSTYYHALGT